MNKNDYRRALIMLRSLRSGVSGYVRLERRTLIGTLHFTVNGAQEDAHLYAVLLYRQGGAWHAVRAGELAPPRYGQTGLIWKFDPRNIDGRSLEQYDLTAVLEIRSGICDLMLCGQLNGSVEADWSEIRAAACRVFTPVRIAGTPIAPIDEQTPVIPENETKSVRNERDPDEENEAAADDTSQSPDMNPAENETPLPDDKAEPLREKANPEETDHSAGTDVSERALPLPSPPLTAEAENAVFQSAEAPAPDEFIRDEMDTPAAGGIQEDGIDTPAGVNPSDGQADAREIEADELDTPATPHEADDAEQTPEKERAAAGDLLNLSDRNAPWPECIASLQKLFFTSQPAYPFEAEGYVFIHAPLPEETGYDGCYVGIYCEDGVPARVCYALPAAYTPDPPAGLEDYVWRGDSGSGYWAICHAIIPDR